MIPDPLRDKYPHLKEFWPYLELLEKESDRGKVLISTGFLEEQLRQILLAFMIDTPAAVKLVDGGTAPLGTFSSRITACYILGLISQDEHNDLHHIRQIRNEFAHDIHTTFETQSVVSRCKELRHKAPDYVHPDQGAVTVNPQGQFTTAAVALIMNLINRPHYVGLERRQLLKQPASRLEKGPMQ